MVGKEGQALKQRYMKSSMTLQISNSTAWEALLETVEVPNNPFNVSYSTQAYHALNTKRGDVGTGTTNTPGEDPTGISVPAHRSGTDVHHLPPTDVIKDG